MNGVKNAIVYIILTRVTRCAVFLILLIISYFLQVNRRILQNVFKDDLPQVTIFVSSRVNPRSSLIDICMIHQVALTKANINEACLLYMEGRCKLYRHCYRIHLIPPSRTFTDAGAASDSPESELIDDPIVVLPPPSKPLLPPVMIISVYPFVILYLPDFADNLPRRTK